MDNDGPPQDDEKPAQPVWKVEGEKSMDRMLEQPLPGDPDDDGGGTMIFTDEHGRRRRIPAQRGTLSSGEMRAAAHALHADLGGPTVDYARVAVIERLNELRASGKMSEEDYQREKKRLENYG